MSRFAQDDRIVRGMTRQLAARRARIDAGEKPLGWKVGFGAPAAQEKFKLDAPLVAFLMETGRLDSGARVDVRGWAKPVAEPEIAVHLGGDLGVDATEAELRGAISALGPAIELADMTPPPEDVETILTGNIFQRHVVLAPSRNAHGGTKLDGLTGRVFRSGAEMASTTDLEANTGRLVDVVRHVANVLAQFGERLRAGEIIICGSVTPPIFVEPGDKSIAFALQPIARAEVSFDRG